MNRDLYRLTLRQLAVGRRALVLSLIPLAIGLIAVAYAAFHGDESAGDFYARLVNRTFIPDALAFVSMVLGASAFGDDRDDGSILYIAATPLARRAIVLPKLAAAWSTAVALCLPGLLLCLAFGLGSAIDARAVALSLGALAVTTLGYVCLAGWLSLTARRPVVIGFLYILFWEGSIATWAPSAQWLSIGAYGKVLVSASVPSTAALGPDLPALAAAIVSVAIAAVAIVAATRRFGRVELP